MKRIGVAGLVAAFLILGLTPNPGWCPPPPSILAPNNPRFEFGTTVVGEHKVVSIDFSAAAFMSTDYRAVLASPAVAFADPADQLHFSVDTVGTTCIPGTIVDVNVRCRLSMAFKPRAVGRMVSRIFVLQVVSTDPLFPNPQPIAFLTASGDGIPAPVPTLTPGWTALLAAMVLLAGGTLLRK